jgi:uncharacterized peroxidase-related enzyme
VKDEALVQAIRTDYTTAPISPAERALLDYAVKLAREPWAMQQEDIERLRAVGWSDAAILDLAMVAAYYAFVNRLAQGLGVELEARWGKAP